MSYLSIVFLTCVHFITLSPVYSDVQPQELNAETENLIGVSKTTEDTLEYERRQAIYWNYLDTQESGKQEWIDPFDIIGFSGKQLKEQLDVKTTFPKPPIPIPNANDDKVSSSIAISEKVFTSTTANETLSISKERNGNCALDNINVTQWVKKLLLRIEKEADMETISISFSLDSAMLGNLKKMSTSQSFEISMLDEMLSNLLAQAVITRREGYNWEDVYAYYTNVFWAIVYGLGIAVVMYALHRSTLFLFGMELWPSNTGSRVEELQHLTPLLEVTEAVHSTAAGVETACVEAILDEDSNRTTSFTQASESCRSKSVEYIFQYEAGLSRGQKDSQTFNCLVISDPLSFESSVNDKTVSGEELAAQSNYFNSSTSKYDKYMYSKTEVIGSGENIAENSDKVALPFQTSPERRTPMIVFEATSKRDHDMHDNSEKDTKNVVDFKSTQLHSNDEGMCLDVDKELETSNLPDSLSDSFEILPTPHCDDNCSVSKFYIKGPAGPNCDTTKDILQEMHAGCKFCN